MARRGARRGALALTIALAIVVASSSGLPLPDRRLSMTVYVQHSSQFPTYVDKFVEHAGSLNIASALCFNPGHIGPNTTLPKPYCHDGFHVPLREKLPELQLHPIIQMANSVALYNIAHFGHFTKAFVDAAVAYDIDGYLVNAEVAKGSYDDGKAYKTMLEFFGSELHAHNKTLGVFLQNYDSHFTPGSIINAIGTVDYWVTVYQPASCADVNNFNWGIAGKGFANKGGAMLYADHGDLNAASCIDGIFDVMNKSQVRSMSFWSDFSGMGDVWWAPMKSWLNGVPESKLN